MAVSEKLCLLFAQRELSWLIDRLVSRLERGQAIDRGTATLADPEATQRRAIDDLFGRRSTSGKSLSVDLAQLGLTLNLSGDELLSLVEHLRGPVGNRHAEKAAETAAWDQLMSRWRQAFAADPPMLRWLDGMARNGVLKRLSGGDLSRANTLLDQTRQIVDTGTHDDTLLATLAARITGDSHALDRGQPLANLCLRAIAEHHAIDGTTSADARREAWSAIGVGIDDLSAPALCLNLRPAATSEAAAWIDWHLRHGEPFYLPWRQAHVFEPDPAMTAVFVCENPAIVSEAANRLGPESHPLLCLNGVPAGAVRTLLRRLQTTGIRLCLHADFDWAGLRIIDRLYRTENAQLWRMSLADYLACRPGQELRGAPCAPEWAVELAGAMETSGLAAYEEEMVDRMIADLDRQSPPAP